MENVKSLKKTGPQRFANWKPHSGKRPTEYEKDTTKRRQKRNQRKKGLFRGAFELANICGGKIFVLYQDENLNSWVYCNDEKMWADYEEGDGLRKEHFSANTSRCDENNSVILTRYPAKVVVEESASSIMRGIETADVPDIHEAEIPEIPMETVAVTETEVAVSSIADAEQIPETEIWHDVVVVNSTDEHPTPTKQSILPLSFAPNESGEQYVIIQSAAEVHAITPTPITASQEPPVTDVSNSSVTELKSEVKVAAVAHEELTGKYQKLRKQYTFGQVGKRPSAGGEVKSTTEEKVTLCYVCGGIFVEGQEDSKGPWAACRNEKKCNSWAHFKCVGWEKFIGKSVKRKILICSSCKKDESTISK